MLHALETVLALLGVAIVSMVFVNFSQSSDRVVQNKSPQPPALMNQGQTTPLVTQTTPLSGAPVTDIVRANMPRSSLQVGGGSYSDPWALLGIPHPSSGVLPDQYTLHDSFQAKIFEAQAKRASQAEIQALHFAYMAVLNHTALRLSRQLQLRQLPQATTMIDSADVKRVVQHLERDRDTFSKEAARMESWSSILSGNLQASESKIKELEGRLRQAEGHARCAPSWSGALADFVHEKCVQGDSMKVGSAELHEAFLEFMRSSHPQIEAPVHKAFRELLEHLGYEYDQVYIEGTNKRGFRGISLHKPTAQLQIKHEFV